MEPPWPDHVPPIGDRIVPVAESIEEIHQPALRVMFRGLWRECNQDPATFASVMVKILAHCAVLLQQLRDQDREVMDGE